MERLIVLDTETTGLDPKEGHRIIEIGAIEILNREITGKKFHKYIFSGKEVGDSFRVHGISNAYLRKHGNEFKKIIDDLISFIESSTLVIHNAPFDLNFLNNELKLAGIKNSIESFCNKNKPIIDTLEADKEKNPSQRHSLDALCRRYEIDDSSRTKHGALIDSKILAKVYLAMTGGQENLDLGVTDNNPNYINSSLMNNNIKNKEKIKVIFANKEEIKLHNNYFN
ncbi:MAG: DNA polymerase III subunit epsilon [Pseudomonadota bacterium]|nr:DNA polymerase III subunit epsilon [Pseudomonadota bacterium]